MTLVAVSPNVVVVNPSVPAKPLQGLVQPIRDNPGKYSSQVPASDRPRICGGELSGSL